MRHRGNYPLMVVAQLYGNIYWLLGKRHQEDVFERLLRMLCLVGGEPFLKKTRETVTIDNLSCILCPDGELTVTLQG